MANLGAKLPQGIYQVVVAENLDPFSLIVSVSSALPQQYDSASYAGGSFKETCLSLQQIIED
jgi:hypothetical protein